MDNRLNNTQVKQAKPKEKQYELSDGKGLYLRVRPSGSKSWLFRYTHPSTKKKQNLTIGTFPEVSISEARKQKSIFREQLANNKDPKQQIQLEELKTADTFKSVTHTWLDIKKTEITADYAQDIIRSFELHLFPKLANFPIKDLTAPLVIEVLKPLEAKGSHETLRRICSRTNEVMTYATNTGLIHHNPLSGISSAFRKPQKNNLPSIKPDLLPQFLESLINTSIRPTTRNLILWQLHTLVRPSEASGAMWSEIDSEKKLWVIPAERMKKKREHSVPLTDEALKILERMKAISSNSEYIFASDRDKKRPANSQTANMAISRMGYKGQLVAHGLRSIGSTTLNEKGYDRDLIEAALAHVDQDSTRAAYNRAEYVEQRREMMTWWSSHISTSLTFSM